MAATESLLSGRVVDATGGVISGARVMARSPSTSDERLAVSDEQGLFQVRIGAGPVQLEVRAEAYAAVHQATEAPARDVVLVLSPASRLAGVVFSAEPRQPLAGVLVKATTRDRVPSQQRAIRTDQLGEFVLDDIASGEYEVLALDDAWRSDTRVVTLGVAEASARIELVAKGASSLSGTVQVEGRPCVDGHAQLAGNGLATTAAITQSNLRFDSVWSGWYELTLGCGNALPWHERLYLGLEPARRAWDLLRGLGLDGMVLNADGSPRAGALVDVRALVETTERARSRCISDDDGTFSCTGLVPGRYEVRLGDVELESDAVEVTMPASERLVLRSMPLAHLEVFLEGVDGADLTQLAVSARRAGRPAIPGQRDGGKFVFSALPLGLYDVTLEGSSVHAAVPLESAGELVRLQLNAPPRSEISGTVVDDQGQAVPDVWVLARPAHAPLAVFLPPVGILSLSDAEGRFSIAGLFDGSYFLSAAGSAGEGGVMAVAGDRHDIRIALKRLH